MLGEVWSDTIKAPLVYRGGPSVEPFLHSWVDRSLFQNLGHGTGKQIFQLLDPKSDDPKFPWATYRDWFQQDTLAALMVGRGGADGAVGCGRERTAGAAGRG